MPVFEQSATKVPKLVLLANPDRAEYSVINESSVDVWIGYTNLVTASGFSTGIPVLANGGSIEDRWHKGEIWIVSNLPTTVSIVEDNKVMNDGVRA